MNDLLALTTGEIRRNYSTGDLTPAEVLDATLDHAAAVNPDINAIAAWNEGEARAEAEHAGRRWREGTQRGPLDGIPISIKDSVAARGLPWRHGTAANRSLPASDFDAPPAARLKEAGALVFAKTTMPDFGMLASGVSSLYGITRNPWDLSMSPGGSSAGAGASLAAGIGWGSVGSDIAGSVRLPASHCGLVALKPTQGRIPHLAPSTVRSAGPMARSVAETAELFSVLCRPDARDNLSLPPVGTPPEPLEPEALSVGVLMDMGYGVPASPEVRETVGRAAGHLRAAGAVVRSVSPPFQVDPYPALDLLFAVRARTEWEAFPEEDRQLVLPEVSSWARAAAALSATDYERAIGQVQRAQSQLTAALSEFDIVLSPIVPVASFGAEQVGMDPLQPLAHTSFTCWFNQTGQPAASLCFGFHAGHPIGVQIVGRRFNDERVLQLAAWLEGRRGFDMDWPTVPRTQKQVAEFTLVH